MLCCYVGQFLIFLCPVSFAPACNFVWPHVEEVIADIEGMWRKVRDDFPETLGRQETSPDKSEIVEVADDGDSGSIQFASSSLVVLGGWLGFLSYCFRHLTNFLFSEHGVHW